MKTLSLKVPDDLDREIEDLARRKGWEQVPGNSPGHRRIRAAR